MDETVLTADDLLALVEPGAQTRVALSADGLWAACEVRRRFGGGDEGLDEPPNREVRIFDLRRSATKGMSVLRAPGLSWRPAWGPRPAGPLNAGDLTSAGRAPASGNLPIRLAFYGAEGAKARPRLYVWESGSTRQVGAAVTRPRWFGLDRPWWSPDGRSLLATLWPDGLRTPQLRREPEPDSVEIQVYGTSHMPARPAAPDEDPWWPLRADVGLIDVARGRVERRLMSGVALLWTHPSPDWQWLAAYTVHDARRTELWLVRLGGTEPAPHLIADDLERSGSLRHTPAWSPDGAYLAWVRQGRPFVRGVGDGEGPARELGLPVDVKCSHLYLAWTPDGRQVLARVRDRFWLLPASGEPGRELAGLPDAEVPLQPLQRNGDTWLASPDGASLVLPTIDRSSSHRRLWAIPLAGEPAPTLLRDEGRHLQFQSVSPIGDWFADVAVDGRTAVFAAGDGTHPLDLYRTDLVSGAGTREKRVSRLNPRLERCAFGSIQMLHYTSPHGRDLGAVLLLPPGAERPSALPLVVFVYPGAILPTDEAHKFVPEIDMVVSAHLLAARGYAVLRPDMPWPAEPRHAPMQAIADLVVPGIDEAVRQGWADPARVAVVGHSYGGYAVLALLAATTRFRAGIASAAIGDLVSFYGEARLRAGGVVEPLWQDWAENRQGEMGGPPWEHPERYVANSPVFQLPRMSAPVLLLAEGRNGGDLRQAAEVFTGLQRLGKEVVMVTYQKARHLPSAAEPRYFRDIAERVCDWLTRHLA